MHHACPDCNTELTPSIVGYLCDGCGSVHSFEKLASTQLTSGKRPAKPIAKTPQSNQKSSQSVKLAGNSKSPTRIAHIKKKVKSFVLPVISELPKPIDDSHLLNDHYPADTSIPQTPLGALTAATPPLAAAVQQNEIASEQKNESFAQYMHQQDIESGQTSTIEAKHSSSSKTNMVPIIVAIAVMTAGIALILALAYNL